jgi:hypothetical protein
MQQRSTGVERLLATMQDPGNHEIDGEADDRNTDDGAAGDVARGADAFDGFAHDEADQHQHHETVEQRSQDFGAYQAVGMQHAGRPPRQPGGSGGQSQSRTVGEHVGRVSQQRERARPPAGHGLDRGEGQRQQQRDEQGSVLRMRCVMVGVLLRPQTCAVIVFMRVHSNRSDRPAG